MTAPYATPVFDGRNLIANPPRTQLWGLLYAQVTQVDGTSQRNVLLDRAVAHLPERDVIPGTKVTRLLPRGTAATVWQRNRVEQILASLALPPTQPLSVVVVETLPDLGNLNDPIGGDLGQVRLLRTSPLTAVPALC